MLAEVKAALGDDASAKQYLSMVRNRALLLHQKLM